jgi:hypothetical protein
MMSADALYAEFAGIPKNSVMASCEQLLKLVREMCPHATKLTISATFTDRQDQRWIKSSVQGKVAGGG